MKKYTSEFLGTFCLVFAGTGAIVINQMTGGVIICQSARRLARTKGHRG